MMPLVSVLGCGTWLFLIEEQLYSRQGTVGAALAALCQWLERHHPQAHCREGSSECLENHGRWYGTVSAQGTAHLVAVAVRTQPGVLSERSALSRCDRDPYHDGRPGTRGSHPEQARLLVGFIPPSQYGPRYVAISRPAESPARPLLQPDGARVSPHAPNREAAL